MANVKSNVDELGRPLLRIGEAAEYLGVGSATVRAYSDDGRLAYTRSSDKPNAQRLYRIADLERFGRVNHIRRRKATTESIDFDSMPDDAKVGINHAAKYLGISSMTIRNYVRSGDIPCSREGGRHAMMFKKGDLDAFAASHTNIRRRIRRRPDSPENFDFSFDTCNMAKMSMSIHGKNLLDTVISRILAAGYADNARYMEMTEVFIATDGALHFTQVYRVECDVPMKSIDSAMSIVNELVGSDGNVSYKRNQAQINDTENSGSE